MFQDYPRGIGIPTVGPLVVSFELRREIGAPVEAQFMSKESPPTPMDPRERGAKPPYKSQPQKPPGLDQKMDPVPDHGEKGYQASGRLAGRVALITGGDSGIGKAIALLYAQEGAKVVITCLEEERPDADATVAEIKRLGSDGFSMPGDIRQKRFCSELVAKTVDTYGRLDILVNNAAFQRYYEKIDAVTEDELDACFRTNVYALVYLSQAAAPHLKAGASILNTSSIQALQPTPELFVYAATKAAIANITKGLAGLFMKQGVRVNAVAPGPVWTPFVPTTLPDEMVKEFGKDTLFKRPAQPVEQASLFVFLASADASYVTGEMFSATGGSTPL